MDKEYTLITGASEGLGKHLSLECARLGMNLVLIALPESGLLRLADYIIKTYRVETICIEKDLAKKESCYEIQNELKARGISISVLINNAGIGGTYSFDEKNPEYYNNLINLNVITPTILCRLFLADLEKSSRGFILNVSSLAAIFNLPCKQVYSGTKSYLLSFSKSLRLELKNRNVSVSVLCPGGMNTYWRLMMDNRITGTWISRQSVMEPGMVAAIAMKKLFEKKELIIPGFWNKLFILFNSIIPNKLKEILMNYQIARTVKRDHHPVNQPQFAIVGMRKVG